METSLAEPVARGAGGTTRSSLLRAVTDPAGGTRWEEFDRTYRAVVVGMARRSGLGHHDAEDVAQDVFRSLVVSLTRYEVRPHKGSFRRYLANLVRWRVQSKFRVQQRQPRTLATEDEVEVAVAGPDEDGRPASGDPDFRAAVVGAMAAMGADLSDRDLQILHLYYCNEWTVERIAELLKVSEGHVYVIAHRNKQRLIREIKRRL